MVIKAKHSDQLTTRLPCMDRFFKTRLRVTWQLIYFGLLLNPGIAAISPRRRQVDLGISTTIIFNKIECYYSAENCAVVQNQIGLYPPTFPTLCKDIPLLMRLSLAIGLLARRVGAPKAGLCQSMTNRSIRLSLGVLDNPRRHTKI